jgi:O-methyltransferase
MPTPKGPRFKPMQKKRGFKTWLAKFVKKSFRFLTAPVAIIFLTYSHKVHAGYGMSWGKRMRLGFRFWWNHSNVTSGTSWRAHLVMAMKLLEIAPGKQGSVVECGCWKGGATVNLSLICKITGRTLKVYDSFEGLPAPKPGDPYAALAEEKFKNGFIPGVFGGTLEEVKENVRRYGAIDVCEFHQGWFENTLQHHEDDIVLAFLDVDLFASLHDCLTNLWPFVIEGGYIFVDEYLSIDYCAVFYSEKFWDKYFSIAPPGLIGIGTGVQVGMFYTDPFDTWNSRALQTPDSVAYCIKGTRALWEYYPDEFGSDAQTPEKPKA